MTVLNNKYLITAMDVNPSPSQVTFAKLLTALDNDEIDLQIVADIIQIEPSLSTAVLKLSNSAYYGHERPCQSIQEALSCLGTEEVLKIVALTSVSDSLTLQYKAYPYTPNEFWETAILTSLIMEQLAGRYGYEPLTAYSVGLLHSIGKIIINDYLLEHRDSTAYAPRVSYIDLTVWERTNIGLDHADITGLLMKKWNFPKILRFPIQYQMRPANAPDKYKNLTHFLRIAIALAAKIAMPEENETTLEDTPIDVFEEVNLKPSEALEYASTAKDGLARVHEMMRGMH